MSQAGINPKIPSVVRLLRERAPRWLEDSVDIHATETLPATGLLSGAVRAEASDVHVLIDEHRGADVFLRIHGTVSKLLTLDPEQAERLHRQLRVLCGLSTGPTRRPEQGHARIEPEDAPAFDIRLSAVPTSTGASLAVRLMTTGVADYTPGALGIAPDAERVLRDWFRSAGGLMLIVGPTGSGKTTTLYTLLRHCVPPGLRVMTVEQPVEADIDGMPQVPAGTDSDHAIVDVLGHVLRQDPDVIAIGEILDTDTARAAVRASLAGHGVVATAHAPSATGAVTWLRHCGAHDYEISETLTAVVAQRLVRVLCPECKRPVELSPDDARLFTSTGLDVPDGVFEAAGCDRCGDTGFARRTGVFDIWTPHPDDPGRIRRGEDHSRLDQAPGGLLRAGLALVSRGETTIGEVLRFCPRTGPVATLQDPKRAISTRS